MSTGNSLKHQEDLIKFKIVLVGDISAGKSSLLTRYINGVFSQSIPTIGIDYRTKYFSYKNRDYKMQIWDTAGHQKYRSIIINYFKFSKAAFVIFDMTSLKTLQDTRYWFQLVKVNCGEILTILLGTKSDLLKQYGTEKQILNYTNSLQQKIKQIKREFGCQYFQVSSKTGEHISQAFNYMFQQLADQYSIIDSKDRNFKSIEPDSLEKLYSHVKLDSNIYEKTQNRCCEL